MSVPTRGDASATCYPCGIREGFTDVELLGLKQGDMSLGPSLFGNSLAINALMSSAFSDGAVPADVRGHPSMHLSLPSDDTVGFDLDTPIAVDDPSTHRTSLGLGSQA